MRMLRRHANCVRELLITDGWESEFTNLMPAVVMATICGSQCSSLLALCLTQEDVGLGGPDIIALAALTRLRYLVVRYRWCCPAGAHG